MTILGLPLQVLFGQLTIGLINGCFYALLSLGLSIIFGLLNVINFAHGAFFMLGALAAWLALTVGGINYWWALALAPLVTGLFGIIVERVLLRRLQGLDHLYSLLFTFGLALAIEGIVRDIYGTSGLAYPVPPALRGPVDLGFMRLPAYRIWVVGVALVACFGTWALIEKTRIGSYLRAGTENARLVQALGINVPLLVTLTYGFGVALAGLAGVLAAPIYQVQPQMGSSMLIIIFAVVVIGGLGSTMGTIVTGLALGVIEGLAKVFYPQASSTVVFMIMVVVLLLRPAGLFGKEA